MNEVEFDFLKALMRCAPGELADVDDLEVAIGGRSGPDDEWNRRLSHRARLGQRHQEVGTVDRPDAERGRLATGPVQDLRSREDRHQDGTREPVQFCYLGCVAPAAEVAIASGHHVHVSECGAPGEVVIVPDLEVLEHQANGCDMTQAAGYPIRDRSGHRSAWVLTDGAS